MRLSAIAAFSGGGAFVIAGSLAFALPLAPKSARSVSHAAVGHAAVGHAAPLPTPAQDTSEPRGGSTAPGQAAFASLPTLQFVNQNTQQVADVRLYDDSGNVNELEAARLDGLLCDTRDPKRWAALPLNRRTLQLVVRAALHFGVETVQVVSAYRKPGRRREGPHASGSAIDFKLPGVPAASLASYLRTLPRVGVGIYTHPKTSFVHLDDRLHSFHWLDASPPGRRWRERSLGAAGLDQRDAGYLRAGDWPEGTPAPSGTRF